MWHRISKEKLLQGDRWAGDGVHSKYLNINFASHTTEGAEKDEKSTGSDLKDFNIQLRNSKNFTYQDSQQKSKMCKSCMIKIEAPIKKNKKIKGKTYHCFTFNMISNIWRFFFFFKYIFLILQMKERSKWLNHPYKILLLLLSTEELTHKFSDTQTTAMFM